MSNSQTPNPVDLTMQLATGYVASSSLHAVTRLKIADLLHDGSKRVAELARITSTHEDILYRVLRALATVRIFEKMKQPFSTTR